MRYHHTQVGWVTLGATLAVLPVAGMALWNTDPKTLVFGIGVIGLLGVLFGWLTVDVDDRRLLMTMGVGLIRRHIPLNTIRAFAPVTNRWIYGWGVRLTPHGMLYNVSGLGAVEILFESGRRVRIGTDEPEALVSALAAATHKTGLPSPDAFPNDAGWRNRVRFITGGIAALAVLWVAWNFYVYSRPPSVEMSSFRFAVGTGLHGADVPLARIQSVTLADELPRIVRRTNGFASGGLLRGNFTLDGWGGGKLFINKDSPPYVVVRTRDSFVVVNFADARRTRELYAQLSELAKP